MNRYKALELKLNAILDYLDINLEYEEKYKVNKNKKEFGFCERKDKV
jgi:hypothetical protein